MAVWYDDKEKIFHLQTCSSSYVIGILGEKYLLHLYYGEKIGAYRFLVDNLPVRPTGSWMGNDIEELGYSTDSLSLEYPCYGSADLKTPAFHAEYEDGSAVTCLEYIDYKIFEGKKSLVGLPATYEDEEGNVQTLELYLLDRLTGLKVTLSYSVFEKYDGIAKSVLVENAGKQKIKLKSVLSSATHLFDKRYEFVHLEGNWARERHIQRSPLINGIMSIDSKRVSSSHQHSPFLALARPETTEDIGEVYGCSLVYSGNHIAQTEVNAFDTVRVQLGINPFGFQWLLNPGESFQAPEVILTYSNNGLGQMSRNFHKLYRKCLCRGKYRDIERPVLINNWEATYFDFDEEKIVSIAKKAKQLGIELMVLDDGWFGKRDSDNCSLGDWVADKRKLPNGIEGLAQKISDMDMKFGLWFEPEMVSEDSDLYREHPDWCIHIDGRRKTLCRQQLVLDLSRKDVCDYIVSSLTNVLAAAPVSYVKWDMNRNITELGSALLDKERQQELPHRYILGLYDVLERINTAFPEVLFEGCSGGGGRFDAGMLPYFPQYWTSDDTDAKERLFIQHGTSMVMPLSAIGAHVSAVPNHQVHRTTPLEMRGNVAMMGQLGYELDLNKLTEQEEKTIKEQIELYKEIRTIIHNGSLYRLKSPFEGNNTAWECVLEDGSQAVLMYCTINGAVMRGRTCVKLKGLIADEQYTIKGKDSLYSGDYLMNVGLYFSDDMDYDSRLLIINKADISM